MTDDALKIWLVPERPAARSAALLAIHVHGADSVALRIERDDRSGRALMTRLQLLVLAGYVERFGTAWGAGTRSSREHHVSPHVSVMPAHDVIYISCEGHRSTFNPSHHATVDCLHSALIAAAEAMDAITRGER